MGPPGDHLWPLQVQMFLKDTWISTLKVAMRSSLRDMSKGWYNLYETNWEVYLMSKLRKLMELLKYILQDTLRFLVQDSLTNFSQFISDTCCSVLDCTNDMVWGEDFINSPYRWGPARQKAPELFLARCRWLGQCRVGGPGQPELGAQHCGVLDARGSLAPAPFAGEYSTSSDCQVLW